MSGVGDVVLAFADESAITLWSVTATQGWVYNVERDGPRSVVIKFFNTQTHDEAEFQAELEGNRIKVEVGGDD